MRHLQKRLKVLLSLCCILAIITPVIAQENNLVKNGNFEEIKDGTAAHWDILEGAAGNVANYPAEPGKGHIGHVNSANNTKSAYLSQWVNLEPQQNYRLSMHAKMTAGKLTFAIGSNGLNKRMYGELREELPMSPWFWDESWLASFPFEPGQWREVSMEFNSGEIKRVLVTLGGFFSKGEYAFDDITLVKIADK